MGGKADQRVVRLLNRVQSGGLIALSEAATLFDVSEMTVRRDIAGSNGRLTVLGGHVMAPPEPEAPYALADEEDSHIDAKAEACSHALPLIERNDTIFIDSGTTTCHIASALPADLKLTVICFSMNVAAILARMPGIRWMLTGGLYENSTASFSGPHGPAMLKDVRINKAFLSAGGVHARLGASCANFSEVAMKRAVIDKAAESFLVIDSSKLGKVKAAHFADWAEFTAVLTERGHLSAQHTNSDHRTADRRARRR